MIVRVAPATLVLHMLQVMGDEGIQAWVENNKRWLEPYAAFKVQMQKEKGFNNKWWDCTTWSKKASEVQSIVNSGSHDYHQVHLNPKHAPCSRIPSPELLTPSTP